MSFLLLGGLYLHLKNFSYATFLTFLSLLPFAKGKAILDIVLLDKYFIKKNALFDIDYVFPFYLSSIFLTVFYYQKIREKIIGKKILNISKNNKTIVLIFLFFVVSTTITSINSIFDLPIFASSIQLLLLLLIFFIPFCLKHTKKSFNDLYMSITASSLFQSVWMLLQTLNKGHLGKDIEVFLSGNEFEYSVRSTENYDLLRLPGTFFESSILGTFLLTNVAILAFAYYSKKISDRKQRTVVMLTMVLGTISILLTGSRAIYGIYLFIAFVIKQRFFKNINIVQTVKTNKLFLGLLLGGIVIISPYLINRITTIGQIFSKEGSGTYRVELSKLSLRIAQKQPVWGVGLNLSPYYLATGFIEEDYFVDPAHAHNIFIQLLTEAGLIGTALFITFLYQIYRPYVKNGLNSINEFTLASFVFLLCAQIYPIFINHMEIISFFFLYLGFTALYNQKGKYAK